MNKQSNLLSFDWMLKKADHSTKKLLVATIATFLFISCTSSDSSSANIVKDEDSNNRQEESTEVIPVASVLNLQESEVTWKRYLEQKKTKKQVKLFGKMVDVELGDLQLDLDGEVDLSGGTLTLLDNEIIGAVFEFDMNTFHFAEEKGKGLFDVVEHPHSTLEITDLKAIQQTSESIGTFHLEIEGHKHTFEDTVHCSTNEDGSIGWKTKFIIHTLDFPLRKNPDRDAIKKDEIMVSLNAKFAE